MSNILNMTKASLEIFEQTFINLEKKGEGFPASQGLKITRSIQDCLENDLQQFSTHQQFDLIEMFERVENLLAQFKGSGSEEPSLAKIAKEIIELHFQAL